MPSDIDEWFTPECGARTKLCKKLEEKGAEWLKARHLTLRDVQTVVRFGEAAEAADKDQKAQLAAQAAARKKRSVDAAALLERESVLADVLPAVIQDLEEDGHEDHARFLAKLSFARYRIRVIALPVDPAAPADAETKRVERVEKADIATRAEGLAAFCEVLRQPGREPVVALLAQRGFDADVLTQIGADASVVSSQGKNALLPVEATAREEAAVLAQRTRWSSIRDLVARAVQGDSTLERMFAEC